MAKQKLSKFSQHNIDELIDIGNVVIPAVKPDIDNYIVPIDEFGKAADIDVLKIRLENEHNRAVSAENAITASITGLNTELKQELNAETTRAINAENEIKTNISELKTEIETDIKSEIKTETNRAIEAETSIINQLNAEITRSTNKDSELSNLIDTVSGSLYNTILSGDTNLQIDINDITADLQASKNLIAGQGVDINETEDSIIISAEGRVYQPGDYIDISDDAVISVTDTENLYIDDTLRVVTADDGMIIGANVENVFIDNTLKLKYLDDGVELGVNNNALFNNLHGDNKYIDIIKSESNTSETQITVTPQMLTLLETISAIFNPANIPQGISTLKCTNIEGQDIKFEWL